MTTKTLCCEKLRINGVLTHELGCPEAWRDKDLNCKWCDSPFKPEGPRQQFCDASCYAAYNGLPYDEEGGN